MKKVLLQVWEESDIKQGIRQNGCSLHISEKERRYYINSIYDERDINNIPDTYEKVIGNPIWVNIEKSLYDNLKELKSIRLMRYEMDNLLEMQELIIKNP
jgi:hypothetical protein